MNTSVKACLDTLIYFYAESLAHHQLIHGTEPRNEYTFSLFTIRISGAAVKNYTTAHDKEYSHMLVHHVSAVTFFSLFGIP